MEIRLRSLEQRYDIADFSPIADPDIAICFDAGAPLCFECEFRFELWAHLPEPNSKRKNEPQTDQKSLIMAVLNKPALRLIDLFRKQALWLN
jgi:hypothetical protein